MAFDDVAIRHEDQLALLIDDGVERHDVSEHAHDLELLLVQGIANKIARDRSGILHEGRGVEGSDRVGMSDARSNNLAPAGVARHEMRLDQAGGDADLRLDEAAIELDRHAPSLGPAEIDVGRIVAREMIDHPDLVKNPGITDNPRELLTFVGTV